MQMRRVGMRRMAPRDSKNHASAGMPSKLTNGSRAIGFVLRFGGGRAHTQSTQRIFSGGRSTTQRQGRGWDERKKLRSLSGDPVGAQRLRRILPLPSRSQSSEIFSFVAIVSKKSVWGVVPLS